MLGRMEAQQTPGGGQPPAPGWYPDPSQQGAQRWWDGNQWTQQTQAAQQQGAWPATTATAVPDQNSRQLAMFAHLSAILTGFIGPLVFYLVKKDEDPFVGDQSREALNFNLSVLIYVLGITVVSFILMIVLIGFLTFFLVFPVMIGALVLQIIAGVAANRGEWYRYPLTIRMVN
jgi:hypothetical protein